MNFHLKLHSTPPIHITSIRSHSISSVQATSGSQVFMYSVKLTRIHATEVGRNVAGWVFNNNRAQANRNTKPKLSIRRTVY